MEEARNFAVRIGGQAGQGVKSAGLLLAKTASRSGYFIYNYTEYPSLIRGGHNILQVTIGKDEVSAPQKRADLLIALNQESVDLDGRELEAGGGILFDSEAGFDLSGINSGVVQYPVPLRKLAVGTGGEAILINTVAIGAAVGILGGELTVLLNLLREEFTRKGEKVVEVNEKAARAGFDFAAQNLAGGKQVILTPVSKPQTLMVINGNEAMALGSVAARMQFAAIYPMTPITGLMHALASLQEKSGFLYKQPEDEIAAVNMAIGASFAGARSLTATSGGGFCLMTEGLGLAAMTETPLVVILGMRPGPATGLPTWSEQGDLQFVLHAHQGDLPRIVLAAGDAKEAFELTRDAFNLAEKYQMPVIILVDKNICEHEQSFPFFVTAGFKIDRGKMTISAETDYERYAPSPDGISVRAIPGSGNFFITNSDEHDRSGFSTEESGQRQTQMRKRMSKMLTCASEDMPQPKLYGPKEADLTIVSWGSNKGSILTAIKNFPNVNFLYLTWMNPFPTEAVRNILAEANYILDVEANYSGQLAELIREKAGIEIMDRLLKYDGRPIFPEEIIYRLESILRNMNLKN